MPARCHFWLLSLIVWVLSACSALPMRPSEEAQGLGPLEERHYDVEVLTHDGERLRATVFQPALAAGETAPLLVHAHGFGVFRMSGPVSIYGQLIHSGITALEAWRRGYWVISYDQRGHGSSEGMIRVMDPEQEVRDVSTVIDWMTRGTPRIARDTQGDPVIGMIGESYGGGAQLMASARDPRIDAIVPITTWHSFDTSLAPNDVPKSGWLTTLVTVANSLNPGSVDPIVNRAYWEARDGRVSGEIFSFLRTHAPAWNCQQGDLPKADVFFIQGMRDVLFPLNEALSNYECVRKNGRDVRLVATQDGHLLPFTQWSWVPGYNIDREVHCGQRRYDSREMVLDWFDARLRGREEKARDLPRLCLTHDRDTGSNFGEIPRGGASLKVPPVQLGSNFTGLFEFPLIPVEYAAGAAMPDMKSPELQDHARLESGLRPAFVPLKVLRADGLIAGIPRMSLAMETAEGDHEPILFVGVAVKRADGRQIELLNDQVTPMRGEGHHRGDMMGVSARLHRHDILGLLVFGYHKQYRFNGGDWFAATRLSGRVELPVRQGVGPGDF